MNMLLLNHLASIYKARHVCRSALFLACVVLLLTHMLPAQDSKASKIPEEKHNYAGATGTVLHRL